MTSKKRSMRPLYQLFYYFFSYRVDVVSGVVAFQVHIFVESRLVQIVYHSGYILHYGWSLGIYELEFWGVSPKGSFGFLEMLPEFLFKDAFKPFLWVQIERGSFFFWKGGVNGCSSSLPLTTNLASLQIIYIGNSTVQITIVTSITKNLHWVAQFPF